MKCYIILFIKCDLIIFRLSEEIRLVNCINFNEKIINEMNFFLKQNDIHKMI